MTRVKQIHESFFISSETPLCVAIFDLPGIGEGEVTQRGANLERVEMVCVSFISSAFCQSLPKTLQSAHFPTLSQLCRAYPTCSQARKRYPDVFVELQPGDAVFFHSNLLHTSAQVSALFKIFKLSTHAIAIRGHAIPKPLDIFTGPRSDHSLPLSVTDSLTHSLTDDLVEN